MWTSQRPNITYILFIYAYGYYLFMRINDEFGICDCNKISF